MRKRTLSALACLVALGCSHRHLILQQAPMGAYAVADHAAPYWRLTLLVPGRGWKVGSPDALTNPEAKEEGDRTRIEWTITEARWQEKDDFLISLRKDGEERLVKVRNRSREAQVAEGVAIGVVAVAVVALAVAGSSSGGHHGGSSGKAAPKPVPKPGLKPSGGPMPQAGPHGSLPVHFAPLPGSGPEPFVTISSHQEVVPDPEPLLLVEPADEAEPPGEVSSFLQPVPGGWEAGVELRFLPRNELWTVAGDGFEVVPELGDRAVSASWVVTRTDWEQGRVFAVVFTGADRTYRVQVRLQ